LNAESTNIFDLLLGPLNVEASGGLGVSPEGGDGAIFDGILNSLMGLGGIDGRNPVTGKAVQLPAGTEPSAPKPELWAQLLARSLSGGRSAPPESAEINNPLSMQAQATGDRTTPKTVDDGDARPFDILTRTSIEAEPTDDWVPASHIQDDEAHRGSQERIAAGDRNVVAFNAGLRRALPRENRVVNQSLGHLLNSQPANLGDGQQYRIMSVEQGSGLLHLTLSDPSSDNPPVKVSLPFSALAKATTEVTGANRRVDLSTNQTTSPRLQQLLSRLNLQEITVKQDNQDIPTPGPDTRDGAEPIKVTIVADDSGRRVVLRTQLSAEELRTPLPKGPVEPATTEKAARPLPDGDRTFTPSDPTTIEPARMARAVASSSASAESKAGFDLMRLNGIRAGGQDSSQSTESRLDASWRSEALMSKSGDSGAETAFGGSDQSSPELSARDAATMRQTNTGQTVRFHLPDDFTPALRNGRQSVSIRIEPEHLGPARLTLTERNGGLHARLVVDSPEAKALIESSLDRLSRQLQQANVDVDSIEVTVSSDSEHRQFFHERPEWAGRAVRFGRTDSGDDLDEDSQDMMVPPPTPNEIGAAGVNVLA
jgi:flagellar hook-length control protein FliK